MKKRLKELAELFNEKTKGKEILVISHHDTDGITSAAIMIKTLKRLDKKFSVRIIKNLEEHMIYDLPKNKIVIFLDLASNSLDYIAETKIEDVFILDHHEISKEIPKNVHIINPHLHDKEKISASSITYLFCKELLPEITDLAKLAIMGMIGDQLEKNIDKVNNKILSDSEIIRKRGLLIYPSTRPINKILEFSSNPFIPGVTGNSLGAIKLLRDAGIKPGNNHYPSLIELDENDMSKLITGILLKMPRENSEGLVGDIFLIKMFNKLEDAREISAMINACARLEETGIAIQYCLEMPQVKKKVESLYIKYKRLLLSSLDFASKVEKINGKGFVIINAKNNIKDTIIGTIASILSHSNIYDPGTTIITMAYTKRKIKVSARNVGKQGRNIRELLSSVVDKIGGEVGGHEFAAGCLIQKENENDFIKLIKSAFEIELVKI